MKSIETKKLTGNEEHNLTKARILNAWTQNVSLDCHAPIDTYTHLKNCHDKIHCMIHKKNVLDEIPE